MDLNTERLSISKFRLEDWRVVLAYTSDRHVMEYMPDGIFQEQDAKAFVKQNMGEHAEKFAVRLKERDVLIGHMVFHKWYGENTYEIGWVFHPNYHNNGFATEAAKAVVNYAFVVLNAHRVIATCQPENIPSYRIMEKIGMRREAHFRKCIPAHYKTGGGWWDEYFYAILAEEWKAEF
ncbi:N-acetyltransferase [Paenibacillus sp. 1011MAR3C5]|uniref:GNAT family N-acetyltransferase n=1 Tax=Paenibacillus sp. 1011MAR3C5 TaxID=1675787 RepID=UPI000E6BEA85|nr:GNAT family protein [Paenibacillus sp. 1011MAR3C5]RJE87032.1 N-acetyltransferase [Paenibacillus sp. 1011MAR3C5]